MESFDSVLKALVGAVGVASGAAYIPQAVRIWKRRSSDDVSVVTYLLFLLGQVIWLTYGVRFGLLEIVLGMSANLAGNLAGHPLGLPIPQPRRVTLRPLPVPPGAEEYLAFDKEAGQNAHGFGGLFEEARRALGDDLHLVHRLDRITSGLLLLARGEAALRAAHGAWATQVSKTYLALVRGIPTESEGTIDYPVLEHRSGRPWLMDARRSGGVRPRPRRAAPAWRGALLRPAPAAARALRRPPRGPARAHPLEAPRDPRPRRPPGALAGDRTDAPAPRPPRGHRAPAPGRPALRPGDRPGRRRHRTGAVPARRPDRLGGAARDTRRDGLDVRGAGV